MVSSFSFIKKKTVLYNNDTVKTFTKTDSKDIYIVTKCLFQINAVLLNIDNNNT